MDFSTVRVGTFPGIPRCKPRMRTLTALSTCLLALGSVAQLSDDALVAGITARGSGGQRPASSSAAGDMATYALVDDEALYSRAVDRLERGDAFGALQDLDRVLEREPRDTQALMRHAEAQRTIGKSQSAKTDLYRVLGIEARGSNTESALFELGRIAMDEKDLPTALAHYDHLVAIAADNAQAWCDHGKALSMIRDDDRAITDLEKAIELDPALDEAYVELAMILFRQGRKQEGDHMLQQASDLGDRSVEELMMVRSDR